MVSQQIRVGTAGWALPRASSAQFPALGSHLERYAQRLNLSEINSSFHRSHQRKTYERWARTTPRDFLFSLKLPRTLTHERLLEGAIDGPLEAFLEESAGLQEKRGPLLIQLPPRLAFESAVARSFFKTLRRRFKGWVALEPRHPSWFTAPASTLCRQLGVTRVAADPARVPDSAPASDWGGFVYHRLHGAPRVYYSAYQDDVLKRLSDQLAQQAETVPVFCVFDNTTLGHATENALWVRRRLAVAPLKASPPP